MFGAITRRALFDGVVLDSSLLEALVSGIPFMEDSDDDVDNEENADAYVDETADDAIDVNADADYAVDNDENADAADAIDNDENADAADAVDNDDDADATVDDEDRRGKN